MQFGLLAIIIIIMIILPCVYRDVPWGSLISTAAHISVAEGSGGRHT